MNEPVSYEQYLQEHGTLTYTNVGVSMLPLLRQGRDLFIVKRKGPQRCAAGDVVLYRRPPDKYVLHRIIEVRDDSYVILGDNCTEKEYGIRDDDILGVMTGFVRNGREHSTEDAGYRLYTSFWMHTIGFRRALLKGKAKLRRLIKRIVG